MTIHKKFKLDKSILRSIIAEQAGEVVKAIAEMVMNSIDAGATRIDVEIDAHKFKVSDDGRGFTSLQEIEDYFGTFGTPREHASAYGCFRIGRGQILNISKTYWRSGNFSMSVDLDGTGEDAYVLGEHDEAIKGCVISGEFYSTLNIHEGIQNIQIFENDLKKCLDGLKKPKDVYKSLRKKTFGDKLIKYFSLVKTPIFINGIQISNLIDLELVKETEIAKYYKSPIKSYLFNYNKGVFISESAAHDSLIIDYKKSPILNMARNQINSDCKIYRQSEKERAEYIVELAVKGVETNTINYFTIISRFLNQEASQRNLSVFDECLISLFNKDNIQAIFNSIPVKTYSNGSVETFGFLDFCEYSQAMASNFVYNDYTQRNILENISLSATFNFLKDHNEDRVIVSSQAFDTNDITLNLARYIRSFSPDFKLDVLINRHIIFTREDAFSPYRKKVKRNSKKEESADLGDDEFKGLEKNGFITLDQETIDMNHRFGNILNQVAAQLKEAILEIARDIHVNFKDDVNINNKTKIIVAKEYTSKSFEHNNIVYYVIDYYMLKRKTDITPMLVSFFFGSSTDNHEDFIDLYDQSDENENMVKVIESFNDFGVDLLLFDLNYKIISLIEATKLDYESKNRIKTIRNIIELIRPLDNEAFESLNQHSEKFHTIAV